MVTIVDVAKLANVSIATVSRVLNSDFMVSPEKKKQVLDAIRQLDYKPNRHVKISGNKVIICVVSVFIEDLLYSLRQTALEYGYIFTLYICNDKKNENDLSIFIKSFSKNCLAGILFFGYSPVSDPLWELVKKIPAVLLYDTAVSANTICTVSFNERQISYDLTNVLLEKGCTSPVLVCPLSRQENLFPYSSKLRIRGFRDALEDHGLTFSDKNVIEKDVTIEEGIRLADELVKSPLHPDGILSMCTPTILGCYYRLSQCKVPMDNILLAAFDTEEMIDAFHMPVIKAISDFSSLGQEGIKTLHGIITGDITESRKIYLNHTIINEEKGS